MHARIRHPMNVRATSISLLLLFALSPRLIAHDTWLAPTAYRLAMPGPVALSLTSGMEFPKLDHAIAADRVAEAHWQTARERGKLPAGSSGANALEFRTGTRKGTAIYWVVLHPRPSILKREQVREYIDHLGIPDAEAVHDEWAHKPKSEETAYRYMKYAKTFVRSGADTSRVWAEPAGMRLELVPQNDPMSVRAGGTLEVILLDGGKPLPRHPVALVREGGKEPVTTITDTRGRARLILPDPGRYMVRATTLERSADRTAAWDVHFTTMTLQTAAR